MKISPFSGGFTNFSIRLGFCLAAAVVCAGPARAGEDEVIFSSGEGFRKNWVVTTWGGLEAQVGGGGENGGNAVVTVPGDKASPWCGVTLQLAYDQEKASRAIPLDDDLRDRGMVVVRLNCGKDASGQPVGGQALQAGMTFLLGNGEKKSVPPVPLARLGGPARLDGDPDSWEEVRIPVATLLKNLPDPAAATGILGVSFQYVESPSCQILVSDCRLESK